MVTPSTTLTWKLKLLRQAGAWRVKPDWQEVQVVGLPVQEAQGATQGRQVSGPVAELPYRLAELSSIYPLC